MPNLLDCPREIRDMIYIAYFTKLLADRPYCRMEDEKIISVAHPIADEAMQVAIALIDKAIVSSRDELDGTEGAWKEVQNKSIRVGLFSTVDDRELRRKRLDLAAQIQRQEAEAAALRKRAKALAETGSHASQGRRKVRKKPKADMRRDLKGVRNINMEAYRYEDDKDEC